MVLSTFNKIIEYLCKLALVKSHEICSFENLGGKMLCSQFLEKHDSFKRGKILDWLSAPVS